MAITDRDSLTGVSEAESQITDSVWIIVAAFNEGSFLGATLKSIYCKFPNVVVVDDGSGDDTYTIASAHPIWVLRHLINCGQGAALLTGIEFALDQGAQIVVTFDADGQHSADDIPRLLKPILQGQADVALGSRFLGSCVNMPWSRRVLLRLAVLFTRVVSRVPVTDTHNGLRALSRHAASVIHITQNRMAHASELLDEIRRARLRFCEVPVTIRYSSQTLEKGQGPWNAIRIVSDLLIGRFVR